LDFLRHNLITKGNPEMKQLSVILSLLLGCTALAATASAETTSPAPAPSAEPVTGAQCVECHDAEAKTHIFHGACTTCHTGALAHSQAERPTKVSPGKPATKECLACHKQDARRTNFAFAEHNRAGVQCSDCHGIHTPKVKTTGLAGEKAGTTTALCATCHQDVLARFKLPSHHPVTEGGVACVGCHDPHSGKQTALVGKTEQCTKCHQAVRGPHVFEHPPAAEDCANCHDAHGSPNRNLLTVAQPVLCMQCHSIASNRHGLTGAASNAQPISGAILRDCNGCHGAVHGSSTDQHLRH